MGLDMYLEKHDKITGEIVPDNKLGTREVMYWRKANQIREWIVNNAGYDRQNNCVDFPLSKETLIRLRDDCKRVIDDKSLAKKILPTRSGFFFGSTEYDDWYYDEVRETYVRLKEIIRETDFNKYEICYWESW